MTPILLLRLEAPLLAFGGVAVDARGGTDAFPAVSLLTGLLGNALGWQRNYTDALQTLQDRLRYAVRVDRRGTLLTDYQTADLDHADEGWTTHGRPEGRKGGAGTYEGQHQRWRDYHADAALTIALTLDPPDQAPDLTTLMQALDTPARPLFIGRKPCLPAGRILLGICTALSPVDALQQAPLADEADASILLFERTDEAPGPGVHAMHGTRNWRSGVHGGVQSWRERRWTAPSVVEGTP